MISGALLIGLVACDSEGGSLPSRTGVSASSAVSAPPRPVAAALTQEQARRAVLAVEDFGPGWSAGALTETLPDPAEDEEAKSTGDAACDRVLRDPHAEDDRVAVRAERTFERDGTGVSVVVSVEVHAGNGAAERLRQTRALLESCGDVAVPVDSFNVWYRAIAAPVVADEALGLRMTASPTPTGPGTFTSERMIIRSGPNIVNLLVVQGGVLEPATLDALTRRAAERLADAGRE